MKRRRTSRWRRDRRRGPRAEAAAKRAAGDGPGRRIVRGATSACHICRVITPLAVKSLPPGGHVRPVCGDTRLQVLRLRSRSSASPLSMSAPKSQANCGTGMSQIPPFGSVESRSFRPPVWRRRTWSRRKVPVSGLRRGVRPCGRRPKNATAAGRDRRRPPRGTAVLDAELGAHVRVGPVRRGRATRRRAMPVRVLIRGRPCCRRWCRR